MADQLQLRGGTTAEHSTFVGAAREVTIDTTKNSLVVHDGVTAGGHPLPAVADLASKASTTYVDAADTTLQGNIDAEETARITADTTLQGNINAEETARIAADTTLQGNINAEAAVRAAADNLKANSDNAVFTGSITEEVYNLTGTILAPANGTVQYKVLSANVTFTDALTSGQSMTLMIADGSAYSVTWPSIKWVGGTAPSLATTGYTIFVLWKIGTQLYGTKSGEVA